MVSNTETLTADPIKVERWGLHKSILFAQHIPPVLDWIEILGMWKPSQHIELFVMFLKYTHPAFHIDVKDDVIQYSSIAPYYSFVLIVGTFSCEQGSTWSL